MPAEFTQWKAARLAALQAEDGWLNLIARVPVLPGPYRLGAGQGCDIVLPHGPTVLGDLSVTETGAALHLPDGSVLPFQPTAGFPQLRTPPYLLELHRADDTALRVRDLTLPRHANLTYFPHDPALILRATWTRLPVATTQIIGQKGGQDTSVALTHQASAVWGDHAFTLAATHWKDGLPMFVIRDATSGHQTYGAARFLIGQPVGLDQITLDFNRAHTPPCGFTDHAICPLPPRQNILGFAINAGEFYP